MPFHVFGWLTLSILQSKLFHGQDVPGKVGIHRIQGSWHRIFWYLLQCSEHYCLCYHELANRADGIDHIFATHTHGFYGSRKFGEPSAIVSMEYSERHPPEGGGWKIGSPDAVLVLWNLQSQHPNSDALFELAMPPSIPPCSLCGLIGSMLLPVQRQWGFSGGRSLVWGRKLDVPQHTHDGWIPLQAHVPAGGTDY